MSNCHACSTLLVDFCVCGEVVCLACNRKLNRSDLNCYACGSIKLDRSKLEERGVIPWMDPTKQETTVKPWYEKWFVHPTIGVLCIGCTRNRLDRSTPIAAFYPSFDFTSIRIDMGFSCQKCSCVHPSNPCCH